MYPEIEDDIKIDIPGPEYELKFIRGSGAGGQKVNKTSSTAQLRHLPTGIIITCQTERSQSANKDMAFKILRARLFDLEVKRREAETQARESQKADIAFGSQIRSYVLAPYRMVKDLRTGVDWPARQGARWRSRRVHHRPVDGRETQRRRCPRCSARRRVRCVGGTPAPSSTVYPRLGAYRLIEARAPPDPFQATSRSPHQPETMACRG